MHIFMNTFVKWSIDRSPFWTYPVGCRLTKVTTDTTDQWNSLSQDAVSSSTVNIFKGHLERTIEIGEDGFFMDHWSA